MGFVGAELWEAVTDFDGNSSSEVTVYEGVRRMITGALSVSAKGVSSDAVVEPSTSADAVEVEDLKELVVLMGA